MATVSAGHQLYLYRLFVLEVGVGRQVTLSRMEEVLASDDILPCDLGYETVRELLEHLDAFIRLTVFKKGRVYATVLAQPEWDDALEKANKDDTQKRTSDKGAKSWKRKKGKGALQPIRPRPKNRPKPEEAEITTAEECKPDPTGVELLAESEPTEAAPVAEAEPAGTEPGASVTEPKPVTAPKPTEETKPAPSTPEPATTNSQQAHPFSFAEQVHIGNEQLSALYAILPLDVDPITLLDEDWRVARSTSSYSQLDGVITFPLRYARGAEGEFVEVSMRRGAPSASGRRWFVTNILGAQNVGLSGLPAVGSDAARELAQFAALGPWDDLVSQLNELRAPAFGPADNDELQEYLSVTFHRVRLENKLVTYDSGRRLAFDTGLLTASAQSIIMCFLAFEYGDRLHADGSASHPGDMAWRFEAFRTAEDAELDAPAPEPALYITSLSHLVIQAEANVRVKKSLLLAHGQRLANAIDVAIRRVRRDYRLGTPAYDPIRNQLNLLVPLCLESDAGADYALVLVPEEGHDIGAEQHFEASAVLSLEHAAACARVVSLELPSWLAS
ncbi:MAG: DUF3825 domain-containing protein [Coriobacteriales bacterium]|nr:DUF3825 domain-containing protein [Coriobacteriales bacterium]